MKALIIEDEALAARRLQSLIAECDPDIEVISILESVSDSVEWFKGNTQPDLIFLDIHLEDGLSFSIFEEVRINVPIIFTTAFDEYAIKAFKLKSIDYLLKPIMKDDLARAIQKYKDWQGSISPLININELIQLIAPQRQNYRDRFSVTVGEKLRTIDIADVAYFFSASSITFLVTFTNNQYSLDLSMDKLSNELDPGQFFRINRQYYIGHKAITNVHIYPKSRLKVELNPVVKEMIFVSIDKVTDFKKWLDGR